MTVLALGTFKSTSEYLFDNRMYVISCCGVPTPEKMRADLAENEMPLAYVDEEGKVQAFAFPAVFGQDFFYTHQDGVLFVSDSLADLAVNLGEVSLDQTEVDKLLTKSYCHPDKTLVKGVYRFEGYKWYKVDESGGLKGDYLPFEQLSWESDEACYNDFKCRVNRSIDYWLDCYQGRRMHLLLSGGVDSRLIFLSLVKRGVSFTTQSLVYAPSSNSDNLEDVAIAQYVSEVAGVPHSVTEINVDILGESYMTPIVDLMPCCAHATVGFKVPIDSFAQEGDVIWTGQNMDTFYNLGATKRLSLDKHAIAQMFKRWYLSEGYAKTLPDIVGRAGVFARPFSSIGTIVFRKGYNDSSMNLPANAADYLARFAASDDYVVLRPSATTPGPLEPRISPFDLKQRLFKDKLTYARGGDAQSIATSARLNGAEVIYPYSDTNMLQYFNSYRLTNKDVRSPKRFVYRYVRELAGEIDPRLATFKAPDQCTSVDGVKPVGLYEYACDQLNQKLYREMREVAGLAPFSSQELEGRGAWVSYGKLIRSYWVACFKRQLEQRGVKVTDSQKE